MNGDRKSIKVTIFGSEYPLGGESEEFTKRVAVYVDDMITTIHKSCRTSPPSPWRSSPRSTSPRSS